MKLTAIKNFLLKSNLIRIVYFSFMALYHFIAAQFKRLLKPTIVVNNSVTMMPKDLSGLANVHKGYCCKVEWELDKDLDMIGVYPTIEMLKENRTCVVQCGIVEVLMSQGKVVQESDLSSISNNYDPMIEKIKQQLKVNPADYVAVDMAVNKPKQNKKNSTKRKRK